MRLNQLVIWSVSSVTQWCPTLCNPVDCSTPGFPLHHPLSRDCSNSCPSNWWYHPTILSSVIPFVSCLQSFPSIRVFSNESVLHIRWPKYWSFSFNISPSNEYSGLISFRIDWFDLLAVQGTLKSFLQHHSLFFFISWRLITLQYCSGFCHTSTWISHGYTCIPHPDPPFHLPLHPIPLGLPSAPGPSTCLMHPTWANTTV